ncbi:MAG: hypothetical protein SD837_19655 [Candidatus Electrothrix scaldis]|nr:MAG: hypothetical protein SD837_19655 [Candidatus Electrothrix sp. GW3-3]
MNYLDSIEIIWDGKSALIDDFGQLYKTERHDIQQQNFNIVLTTKRASLNDIVNGLIGVMGLGIAIQNNPWYKLIIGAFAIAIISPMNIKVFNHPSTKTILDLIDSEYGDQYLDAVKLNQLYIDKPELETVVNSFIRKGLLEKEENGRLYFISNVIRHCEVTWLE